MPVTTLSCCSIQAEHGIYSVAATTDDDSKDKQTVSTVAKAEIVFGGWGRDCTSCWSSHTFCLKSGLIDTDEDGKLSVHELSEFLIKFGVDKADRLAMLRQFQEKVDGEIEDMSIDVFHFHEHFQPFWEYLFSEMVQDVIRSQTPTRRRLEKLIAPLHTVDLVPHICIQVMGTTISGQKTTRIRTSS